MSVAKSVGNVEPSQLDWLEVQDEDGKVYRYEKRGNAPNGLAKHVEGQWNGGPQIRAALVRDAGGEAILRQDDPGLPKSIGVEYVSPQPTTPGPVMAMAWYGLLEYVQV
jgi:hypothetical protein